MAGRCSGCGHTDSVKKVRAHVIACPDYIQLHHSEPGRCLDPEAEYTKHRNENTSEARAVRRDQRLLQRFADMEAQHAIQASRWKRPKDILED